MTGQGSSVDNERTEVLGNSVRVPLSYPGKLSRAMGGVLNNQAVICGGSKSGDYNNGAAAQNKCHTLDENGQWLLHSFRLKEARYVGAAATVTIHGEEHLWITGGRGKFANGPNNDLKTTELVSIDGRIPGIISSGNSLNFIMATCSLLKILWSTI